MQIPAGDTLQFQSDLRNMFWSQRGFQRDHLIHQHCQITDAEIAIDLERRKPECYVAGIFAREELIEIILPR
jgi:hypothetical protein